MTEPQVVRRNPRFGSVLPPSQMVQKYIRADRWDRWAALAIGVAVLIVVGLGSAWPMRWLPR